MKLTDFGIACNLDPSNFTYLAGTPAYMGNLFIIKLPKYFLDNHTTFRQIFIRLVQLLMNVVWEKFLLYDRFCQLNYIYKNYEKYLKKLLNLTIFLSKICHFFNSKNYKNYGFTK